MIKTIKNEKKAGRERERQKNANFILCSKFFLLALGGLSAVGFKILPNNLN